MHHSLAGKSPPGLRRFSPEVPFGGPQAKRLSPLHVFGSSIPRREEARIDIRPGPIMEGEIRSAGDDRPETSP